MSGIYNVEGVRYYPPDDTSGLEDLLDNRLLIWHDEFKGGKIDSEKWNNLYGLTRTVQSYAKDVDKVTTVADGLSYRCIKDNPTSGVTYSGAYLTTKERFEFMYGRIEAKMRFPSAAPHHSTFWTLGANTARKLTGEFTPWDSTVGVKFPSCGEIDIAEFNDGTVGARTHWSTGGFDTDTSPSATGGNINSLVSSPTDWHIYACEWTSSAITFYVDGVQKGTWSTSNGAVSGWNPFNHPHFLILNSVFSIGNTPTWDVAQTDVAWVRVYAPTSVTEYVPETGISIDATASISVGQRKWLEPTFTPSNPSDMTLKWMSHNENIVTCYGGMLIGVASGTTYVQCTTKHGYTALCKVTVS